MQQRLRDFAVRRALGATAGDVVRLVVGGVAPVFAAGLAVGLLLAAALGRTLGAVLVDVDPLDPLTFAVTGGLLAPGRACWPSPAPPGAPSASTPHGVLRGS